jgi:hypothetical protein
LEYYKTAIAKKNLPFRGGSESSFVGRMGQNNDDRDIKAYHLDARKMQKTN